MNPKIAIFPGSFDPYTIGHHSIVSKAIHIFDKIIIAFGHNTRKNTRHFDIDLIVDKTKILYADWNKVSVVQYKGLTVNLLKKEKAQFILRGLRNSIDFEYENANAQMNKDLCETVETVFLIPAPEYLFISSSIVRELHQSNAPIEKYIPYSLNSR